MHLTQVPPLLVVSLLHIPGGGGLLTPFGYVLTEKLQPPVFGMDSFWVCNVHIYSPLFSEKPMESPSKSTFCLTISLVITSDPNKLYF